ncbi:hypothetical protein NL676_009198 [Syzygium grande]|nr:hypothetical protein NL676_009198 [Syzygium grande]
MPNSRSPGTQPGLEEGGRGAKTVSSAERSETAEGGLVGGVWFESLEVYIRWSPHDVSLARLPAVKIPFRFSASPFLGPTERAERAAVCFPQFSSCRLAACL